MCWHQLLVTYGYSFCHLATTGFFSCRVLNLSLHQATEQEYRLNLCCVVPILLPTLVLLCLASLSTSVCLPKLGPQESLGMLIMDVSGILKQIVCGSTLHSVDKSVSHSLISCWEGQLSCTSHMCALRTPVAHSNSNPLKLVTNSFVHVATWCYSVLKYVLLYWWVFVELLFRNSTCSERGVMRKLPLLFQIQR